MDIPGSRRTLHGNFGTRRVGDSHGDGSSSSIIISFKTFVFNILIIAFFKIKIMNWCRWTISMSMTAVSRRYHGAHIRNPDPAEQHWASRWSYRVSDLSEGGLGWEGGHRMTYCIRKDCNRFRMSRRVHYTSVK